MGKCKGRLVNVPCVLLLLFLGAQYVAAQETFSTVVDHGISFQNFPRALRISGDNIYALTRHSCTIDSFSQFCAGLSQLSKRGELLEFNYTPAFLSDQESQLVIKGDTFFISGHVIPFIADRTNRLIVTDSKFSQIDTVTYPRTQAHESPLNTGLVETASHFFMYGTRYHETEDRQGSHILRINKETLELEKEIFHMTGDYWNYCNSLHVTDSLDLVYAHRILGANVGINKYEIIKLDSSGAVKQSYIFEDSSSPKRLMATASGEVYFGASVYFEEEFDGLNTSGRVNKLRKDFSEVEWSVRLPAGHKMESKQYQILELIEAENGDIVVCGNVINDDPIRGGNRSGFISRMTNKGDLKWSRIYLFPNEEDPDTTELGNKYSFLRNIVTHPEGGFVALGHHQYNDMDDELNLPMWLLRVDENGCLEGEECQDVIIMDGIDDHTQEPLFTIGTKWTYEFIPDPTDPSEIVHTYITYEVADTLQIADRLAWKITNNRALPAEYMYQDEEEIYFWDTLLNDWQLSYDFGAYNFGNRFYQSAYKGAEEVYVEVADLDYYVIFGDKGRVTGQYLSIEDNGTQEDPLEAKIIEDCGKDYGGLRLGLGIADSPPATHRIGVLRCFERDTSLYNLTNHLKPIPCDTVFTELVNSSVDLGAHQLTVYPNPTTNYLTLNTGELKAGVTIINSLGMVQYAHGPSSTSHKTINTSQWPDGVYFVRFSQGAKVLHTVKVVVIK